jgi:hypothetical protein
MVVEIAISGHQGEAKRLAPPIMAEFAETLQKARGAAGRATITDN